MTQRVVVVGATSQIGRPLCGELIRSGHTVVVFSRDPVRDQTPGCITTVQAACLPGSDDEAGY